MTLRLRATFAERGLDVDLTAPAGRTVALMGPNGSGKSTILGIAAGLLRPDTGEVSLDGRVLTRLGADGRDILVPPHDRHIATLAQDPLLFPHLSVLENVAFAPRSRGVRRSEAHTAARHWLEQVGIPELAERKPAQLSGGQAQRAAIARALAADPGLLLLDEPMAALDVDVTPALRQVLRRVLEGRTAVIVTHDALDALALADTIIVLGEGKVIEDGPAHDVLAQPRSAFAARIAGLNMLEGSWVDGGVRTADGREVRGMVDGLTPANGAQAVAVFRPAAVSVFRDAPGGSPRNSLPVTVTAIEPQGDRVRLRAGSLIADVTPQALAELDLTPGTQVTFTIKATEVAIYPTS